MMLPNALYKEKKELLLELQSKASEYQGRVFSIPSLLFTPID